MILSICPNPSIDTFVWLDNIQAGDVNRIQREERFPGGKGVHVAFAVRELGCSSQLLGFWGGPSGLWIKENCENEGISCFGPVTKEWSRTCLSFKVEGEYMDTELLGNGPQLTEGETEEFLSIFKKLSSQATCITMSGSWPKGASDYSYAALIDCARKNNKKVFLDCTGNQLHNAIKQRPFGIHLNKSEAMAVYNETDPLRLVYKLAEDCDYAILTDGAEGLHLLANGEYVHAQCKIDNIISTVGSGDCLLAGIAVAYRLNMNIIDSAKLAVACGSANCINPKLGMIQNQDVKRIYEQVKISK